MLTLTGRASACCIKASPRIQIDEDCLCDLKGFEVMRMFRKQQMRGWQQLPGVKGESWLIEKQLGIHNQKYAEAWWKMNNDEFEVAAKPEDVRAKPSPNLIQFRRSISSRAFV